MTKRFLGLLTLLSNLHFLSFSQDLCKDPLIVEETGANPFHPDEQILNYRGIAFSNDGFKMFVVGTVGIAEDFVYAYDLEEPYNVSTSKFTEGNIFSYEDIGTWGAHDVVFSEDGHIMFISGWDSNKDITSIYRFDLTTSFDIKSASNTEMVFQIAESAAPVGFDFSKDGKKLFYTLFWENKVKEITFETPYDITSNILDSVSTSLKDQFRRAITSISLSDEGDNLFIAGNTSSDYIISQYRFGTNFDITTIEHENSFPVPDPIGLPNDLEFSQSGDIMISVTAQRGVLKYELEQPLSLDSIQINYQAGIPTSLAKYESFPYSVQITNDGSFVYLRGKSGIHQFKLSEHYNLNSLSYIQSSDELEGRIKFSSDGKYLFNVEDDVLNKYELENPYDVSTRKLIAEYENFRHLDCGDDIRFTTDFDFSSDGMHFYLMTHDPTLFCRYSLTAPYNISTIDRFNPQTISAYFSFPNADYLPNWPRDFLVSDDGLRIFISTQNDKIYQLNLESPHSLNSPILAKIFSTKDYVDEVLDFDFSKDGEKLFLYDGKQVVETYFKENNPPIFTSQNKVAFREGKSYAVLDINATNGDCGPGDFEIDYNLTGVDSKYFHLNEEGVLFFEEIPSYDSPKDENRDNIYQISVSANDGLFISYQDISVIVNKPPETLLGGSILIGEEMVGLGDTDFFGEIVSLSNDGKIIASSAVGNDTNGQSSGHVRVFALENDSWNQLGSTINGSEAGDNLGSNLRLSGNGKVLAIHAREKYEIITYEYENEWIQKGSIISLGTRSGNIAINDDGSIMAIGQTSDHTRGENAGVTEVYRFVNNEWVKDKQVFYGMEDFDNSGTVDLSANGDVLVIGSWGSDYCKPGGGLVTAYKYDGARWNQMGNRFGGIQENNYVGRSLSISSDGTTIASGDVSNLMDWKYVQIHEFKNGEWVMKGEPVYGDHSGDHFGESISLNEDGNMLLVGAPWNSIKDQLVGKVHVFAFDGAFWHEQGDGIYGDGYRDQFGSAVSISSNGSIISVGAPQNDGPCSSFLCNYGHVKVFDLTNQKPLFVTDNEEIFLQESSERFVFDINANNGDSELEDYNVFYSLKGVDSDFFEVGSESGVIEFLEAPDYENPLDEDFNNVYSISVIAIDEVGLESTLELNVHITNANDDLINVLGIEDNRIVIYPTYFENVLNIETDKTPFTVEIYDTSGKLVFQNNYLNGESTMNLNHLQTNALYYVEIEESGGRSLFKVFKK